MDGERPEAGSRGDTIIVDLRATALCAPLGEPTKLSFGTLSRRMTVLIEIELANGIIGFGESWVNWPPWAYVERIAAYEQGIRPLLLGQDARAIGSINDLLADSLIPAGQQAGAVGPMHQAISGVDLALWDLAGKLAGRSVADLCGGRAATVPVYASSIDPGSDIESTCRDLAGVGFSEVKVRVGFGIEADRDLLRRVRKCVGADFGIIADANKAWTIDEAQRMAGVVAEFGVEMIEEPLAHPSLQSIERLFESSGLRIAVGENLYEEAEYRRLGESPAVGALQPDATKNGGFSFMRRIAAITDAVDCALMPHCYGGPLGFLASVHLMAGLGLSGSVEFPVGPGAPFWDLIGGAPTVRNGKVEVPQGPGFGFAPDWDWGQPGVIVPAVAGLSRVAGPC